MPIEEQHFRAIETGIGVLVGRDAISLNCLFYDGGDLILEGSFNGHLASVPTNDHIFYKLTFSDVLALKMIEFGSLCPLDPMSEVMGDCSSFDEIINSHWVAELGGKVTQDHKHYHFGTYDDTFEIVCKGYELKMWASRPFADQKE